MCDIGTSLLCGYNSAIVSMYKIATHFKNEKY
jgi:hypothetical protein